MNTFEKAYTWYSYDESIVDSALQKHRNGLQINEKEFDQLKGFVFSQSLLQTYEKKWNDEAHYFYILHHAQRLWDQKFLKDQVKQLPKGYEDNEFKYKNTMDSFVKRICKYVPQSEQNNVEQMIRNLGCVTEEYANKRNFWVDEMMGLERKKKGLFISETMENCIREIAIFIKADGDIPDHGVQGIREVLKKYNITGRDEINDLMRIMHRLNPMHFVHIQEYESEPSENEKKWWEAFFSPLFD